MHAESTPASGRVVSEASLWGGVVGGVPGTETSLSAFIFEALSTQDTAAGPTMSARDVPARRLPAALGVLCVLESGGLCSLKHWPQNVA